MDKITNYFLEEKGKTEVVANVLSKSLTRYEDIRDEFCRWIEHRTYDCREPVRVGEYTAKRVHEIAPHLDGAGVYNFLVTLRENPEKAESYIEKGFPTK